MTDTSPPDDRGGHEPPADPLVAMRAAWSRAVAAAPLEHRALLARAVAQWEIAIGLATAAAEASHPTATAAEPWRAATEQAFVHYRNALSALEGPRPERAGDERIAELLGECYGLLARIGLDAGMEELRAASGEARQEPASARDLYNRFVDAWESGYERLLLTDEFSRLRGALLNELLRRRGPPGARSEHADGKGR